MTPRFVQLVLGVAMAVSLAGCPGGAELDSPERFPQYNTAAGTGGSAGTSTTGGVGGSVAGTGGTAMAGTAGSGAGTAGSGGGGVTCDYATPMKNNCARAGCHDNISHWAGLNLSGSDLRSVLVDVPATHGDIDCTTGGVYMACAGADLTAKCGSNNDLLIDSQNIDNSWILKKLTGMQGTCGDAMPLPPGDSPTMGWSEDARQCLIEYFRSLATAQ